MVLRLTKGQMLRRFRYFLSWVLAVRQIHLYPVFRRLEKLVSEAIRVIKEAWILLVENANHIQALGLWKLKGYRTRHEYCRGTWGIDSSRISQFRGALPYAKAILEAGKGTPIIEVHIRRMRKHVPAESPLIAQTYELGGDVARELGRAPTPAIFRRSLEVLQAAADNGGLVQIGESALLVNDKASAVQAVIAVLDEVRDIAIEGSKKVKHVIRARRDEEGGWLFDNDSALPDSFTFTVYL